ncbi:MAG: hypothetical protein MJ033_04665 [Victivallaceae bacterium]|nr:hypothetical protein [Victivallaceae bacterium]
MDSLLVGQLIEKCTQIESALRDAGATGSGLKELMAQVPLDAETEKSLKFVRHIRNTCAHAGGVDDDELRDALETASALLKRGISPAKKAKREKKEKTENAPVVRHYLWLEIILVIAVYSCAFLVSLTPRSLNVATLIAFFLVMSWEIFYAARKKNVKALLTGMFLWLLIPSVICLKAQDGRTVYAVAAATGILPPVLSGIGRQSVAYFLAFLLIAASGGGAVRYFYGTAAGLATGIAVSVLLSFPALLFFRK